jgi:hypothetical protein
VYLCAAADTPSDVDASSELLGSFPHRAQTQAQGRVVRQPDAVVLDLQANAVLEPQSDPATARLGMTHHVRDRLTGHPQNGDLHRRG